MTSTTIKIWIVNNPIRRKSVRALLQHSLVKADFLLETELRDKICSSIKSDNAQLMREQFLPYAFSFYGLLQEI